MGPDLSLYSCAPNVAASTMAAIVRHESRGHPQAIGVRIVRSDGGVVRLQRQPRTVREARAWAHWLLAHGYRFDAGLAQINSTNFRRLGLDADSAFDPCANLRAAGRLLGEAYAQAVAKRGSGQEALFAALSTYNTGNEWSGFRNGYINAVARAAKGE